MYFSAVRNDEDKWYYGLVTLPEGGSILFFEGTRGNGYSGDIAIDDVQLTSGPCASKRFKYNHDHSHTQEKSNFIVSQLPIEPIMPQTNIALLL